MPEAAVQLLLTLNRDGSLNVTGPIDDRVLCYGMLDYAKDVIREYQAQKARLVLPATPPAPPR